ncbi:hypothetical protein APY03_5740 [Variovorax sp. WDL1]|nr:hypothetical protein APY03_5740 [Variovorax sp. WDL1]
MRLGAEQRAIAAGEGAAGNDEQRQRGASSKQPGQSEAHESAAGCNVGHGGMMRRCARGFKCAQ